MVEVAEEGVQCIPAYASLRLFEDSRGWIYGEEHDSAGFAPVAHYTAKKQLVSESSSPGEDMKLSQLYLLCEGSLAITPARGHESAMAILKAMFTLDVTSPEVQAPNFRMAMGLVTSGLPLKFLSYPREYSVLSEVVQAILADNTA
jgi:hypothetical protein